MHICYTSKLHSEDEKSLLTQDIHNYGSWHDSELKSLEGKSDHFDSMLCD